MTNLIFTLEIAQKYLDSNEDFPVPFDEAWQYIGYSTKGNAKQALRSSGLIEGIDWVFMMDHKNSENLEAQSGRPAENISLSVDGFKHFGMMAGTEQGRSVRTYFIECEKLFRKFIKANQNQLEMLRLGELIKESFKQLEKLSSIHTAVVKQEILGSVQPVSNIQMQRDLNTSLVANRLGLAFNKQLKTLELIQDTYSPDAYNKLKDMYQSLAVEYNQLIEKQSTNGFKVSPEDVEFFKQKIKENDEWFADAEIRLQQMTKEAQKVDQENLILKVENKRLREENALLRELLDSPEPPEPDKGVKRLKPGQLQRLRGE